MRVTKKAKKINRHEKGVDMSWLLRLYASSSWESKEFPKDFLFRRSESRQLVLPASHDYLPLAVDPQLTLLAHTPGAVLRTFRRTEWPTLPENGITVAFVVRCRAESSAGLHRFLSKCYYHIPII